MEKFIVGAMMMWIFVLAAGLCVAIWHLIKHANVAKAKENEIEGMREAREKERRMTSPYLYPDTREALCRAYINMWVKKNHPGKAFYFEVPREIFLKIMECDPEYITFRITGSPTRYVLHLDKTTGRPRKITPPIKRRESVKETALTKQSMLNKTIAEAQRWVNSEAVTHQLKEAMASKAQTAVLMIPVEFQSMEIQQALMNELSQWGKPNIDKGQATIVFI